MNEKITQGMDATDSSWGPNPSSVLEAMAAQLPVAAFEVDGVAETVVHGEPGS